MKLFLVIICSKDPIYYNRVQIVISKIIYKSVYIQFDFDFLFSFCLQNVFVTYLNNVTGMKYKCHIIYVKCFYENIFSNN